VVHAVQEICFQICADGSCLWDGAEFMLHWPAVARKQLCLGILFGGIPTLFWGRIGQAETAQDCAVLEQDNKSAFSVDWLVVQPLSRAAGVYGYIWASAHFMKAAFFCK